MNTRLFVGNLSYGTNDADLRQAFEPFGPIASATVITDRMTGQSRGFGFVEYESSDDAQRAIEQLDGSVMDGRSLKVNVARERQPAQRMDGDGAPRGGQQRPRGGRGAPQR